MNTNRLRCLRCEALAATLALLGGCAGPPADPGDGPRAARAPSPLVRHEAETEAMGTRFRVVLYARSIEEARAAARAALARVAELDRTLSDYEPQSELSRLGRRSDAGPFEVPVAVSDDLARVLRVALDVAELTGGAFDPTVGPLTRLWRRARRQGAAPAPERLAAARAATDWRAVELSPQGVRLRLGGMRLDLGGLAKGFAADEALALLARRGIERALVDAGGDLSVGRPPPGADGWVVAVRAFEREVEQRPLALSLSRASVATSGDLFRWLEIGGVRRSHVIDPRSGLGLERRIAATVIAPSGAVADGLASALCVLGAERGIALVESLGGIEARVVTLEDGRIVPCESSGFALNMVPLPESCGPVRLAEDPGAPAKEPHR